jgi:arginine-tRNA-protein transferase
MQYKVRFRPMERLGRDGWERFDPAEQAVAIERLAAAPASDRMVLVGSAGPHR